MVPHFDHYDWAGGREAMLRFGPDTGPILVAALPLFEEANRTRTFLVTLLRALAARGLASALPDLPGQGESLAPLEAQTMATLAEAMTAAAAQCGATGRRTYGLAIRSGALLDIGADHHARWQFAPQGANGLSRDLYRLWQAAGNKGGRAAMMTRTVEIAGNRLTPAFLASIADTDLPEASQSTRVVRPHQNKGHADGWVDAEPLWWRAEPETDPQLVQILADDIIQWIAACEG